MRRVARVMHRAVGAPRTTFRVSVCVLLLASFASGDDLSRLPLLKDYEAMRVGSTDPTGANDDGNSENKIKSGEERVLAELAGPGVISHIWITIASREHYHLKKIVLRMYWDGSETPAVEAPIGDFFGLGLGEYVNFQSGPISVGSQRALNCFFRMPFRRSARITVSNEGEQEISAFYYNVDWEKHASLPDEIGYFHAEYRQETPTRGWTDDWKYNGDDKVDERKNQDAAGNYVFVEAEGRGHLVGVFHSIIQNQGDWWGEGDEMIFIDDRDKPRIVGTGSEDYYLGAWCYGGCGLNPFGDARPYTFAYQRYGNPMNGGDMRGAKWTVYRLHTDSPIPFKSYLRATIEHGHANHRSDNFYTVAYWYQTGEHRLRKPLPPVEKRVPRLHNVEGPTAGRP